MDEARTAQVSPFIHPFKVGAALAKLETCQGTSKMELQASGLFDALREGSAAPSYSAETEQWR